MMKRYPYILILGILLTAGCRQQRQQPPAGMPVADTPYKAAYAVKYTVNPKWADARLRKVVVDGNNSVFILTDKGVFRDFPGDIISKDLTYASLADKTAIDLCVQEETGYLYYLYSDRFLTNSHAGSICGHLTPDVYTAFAVNAGDDVLLVGDAGGALFRRSEKLADIPLPGGKLVRLYVYGKTFWYLTAGALYRLEGREWKTVYEGEGLTALAFSGDDIAVGTSDGYFMIDHSGRITAEKNNRLPVPAINGLLAVDGRYWFSSDDGAYVKCGDGYRYYAWQRWLNRKEVVDMAAGRDGELYLLTPTGLNKLAFRDETLSGKAASIQDDLRKYHLRYGFSMESRLVDPADPTSIQLVDSDNDGLWTSFYLGSQAFRYAVTGDPEAKRYVWESFEPFERLIAIHGIKGFSGRTFERTGYYVSDPRAWRPSPDPDWYWKGTTSTDEFVGYLFVAAVIDQFVAETQEEKKRVAGYVDAIMTHIITNDYYFIDYDGLPTLWGRWNPEYVNAFAPTQFDRRLNSALTITGLQLAYALTGKEIYLTEAYRMMKEHGYLENMKIPMKNIRYTTGFQHQGITMGEDWNHSDDEMAFLTYWVMYHYAFDEALKKEYAAMIADHWEIERPEQNALWNLLTYGTAGDIDLEPTIRYLREFPVDRRRYTVRNSHRKDLAFLPEDVHTNFRAQTTTELIPKGERPMNRHNANEFAIDGGRGGETCLAGDEYLLPYWLARYLKVIE
ncbi:MAG: hypothetical protein LBQ78_04180 [Tannerellaceae bacterium]|jgi:hypothetical protein|nr:hypothetical protein [Tannerellaceae bacterium]